MQPWIIALFQWLGKFTPRYAFVIALLTGVLLFESSKTLKYFNLDTLAHTYRGIIALIFIASVLLLASYPVSIAGNWVVNGINRHRVRRAIKKNLESLGSDQVALLMQYAQSGKSTILIPFHKTAIAEDLLEKGILYRPAQIGNAMDGIGYSITSEAAPFLRYKAFQKILLRGVKKQL